MASNSDLQSMDASVLEDYIIHIAEAVDPLKSEICDLRSRVQKIEDAAGSNPVPSIKTTAEKFEVKSHGKQHASGNKKGSFNLFPLYTRSTGALLQLKKFSLNSFLNSNTLQSIVLSLVHI